MIPSLSVVIVNYANWSATARLTRQLLRSSSARRGDAEVVIVDNGSPRHPLMAKLRRTDHVSLRRWGRNRGFGAAVNEGVRLSRGGWLLLLNPDVSVPDGFLDNVRALTETLPATAGVVGLQLLDTDGTPQSSAGRFPTLTSTLAGLLRPRRERKYLRPHPAARSEVDWLSGCCLLVRRECFAELGGFDPAFFLYYEDVDLCRRARALGWSVVFEPSLYVRHHRPLHSRTVPPHLRVFVRHALLTYAAKHWPAWQTKLLAVLVRAEALVRRVAGLDRLAVEIVSGRADAARRLVDRIARREGRRLAARAVRRRAELQPPRPADRLPPQPDPLRAAGH
jgi:GT2 family glycosyltransferase